LANIYDTRQTTQLDNYGWLTFPGRVSLAKTRWITTA